MAKDDQQEAFEKLLTASLARVVDFTKYGEAKNAALLTFASAWMLATINLMPTGSHPVVSLSRTLGQGALLIAASLAIWAILPRTKQLTFQRDKNAPKNLIHFRDIAMFDTGTFNRQLRSRYMPAEGTSSRDEYFDDLIVQIHANACVASRKFLLFNAGALFALVAVILIAVPPVLVRLPELNVQFNSLTKPSS